MVTVDLASSKYGDRSRQLMAVARKLRDMGAQSYIDIPRIAVIGGQSAGKSSLVEAVSGIRVPRDSGTCTRCPMEVNLVNASVPWTCQISLRFQPDSSEANPLLVPFGSPLSSIDDVELALRRAQAAVLNYPREQPDLFLAKSREELEYYRTPQAFTNGTLKFSKNVVVVDILDPDCANLSFVDLPGLIQNDEQEVVQLVEDLVRSNIQGNCLILVTIPMSDDMENQRAMRLALEADRDKSRTIGVLTKPDTLTSGAVGARKKWRDLLTGSNRTDAYILKLGYYCVKLSDDVERARNPSRAERYATEDNFFSMTEPWNSVSDHKQFGVSNLVKDLSRLLTTILDEILPQLRKEAQVKLDEARAALKRLPVSLVADVSSEVLERVTNFCQEFSGTVRGTVNASTHGLEHSRCCGKSYIHRNRATYTSFKHRIRSTAPDFRPFEDGEEYTKPRFHDPEGYYSEEGVGNGPRDLVYVRNVIKESITWELPNNVPFAAKHELIDEFTREWDEPVVNCFEEVCRNLSTCLKHIQHRHFDRFRKLDNHIGNLVKDLLERHMQLANSFVLESVKHEIDPLHTQNEHYFRSLRLHWFAEYTEARLSQHKFLITRPSSPGLIPTLSPEYEYAKRDDDSYPAAIRPVTNRAVRDVQDRALQALHELGYRGVTREDLPRLVKSPDTFNEELNVMADVRAYFFVAYKRIVDNIPLVIEHELNQKLADGMKMALLQKLNLGAPDAMKRLKELTEEDPDIARQRKELVTNIEKLEQIEAELRVL